MDLANGHRVGFKNSLQSDGMMTNIPKRLVVNARLILVEENLDSA
jgi:hypothetical protein